MDLGMEKAHPWKGGKCQTQTITTLIRKEETQIETITIDSILRFLLKKMSSKIHQEALINRGRVDWLTKGNQGKCLSTKNEEEMSNSHRSRTLSMRSNLRMQISHQGGNQSSSEIKPSLLSRTLQMMPEPQLIWILHETKASHRSRITLKM